MSRNRKNHHYRYAQKFEHEQKRMNYRRLLTAPLVFALLVLLAFGIISTTFSIYVTEVEPGQSVTTDNGLIVKVRSKKITDDIVDGAELAAKATEAEPETEVASEPETEDPDVIHISREPKSDDLVAVSREQDLAETGASQRYIYVGISSNYQTYKTDGQYGFNFWGGTSGGVKSGTYLTTYTWDNRTYYMYRVQVYDDNNKAQFKGNNNWYDPSGGFSVTLNGTTNNAVFFSHSNDGWGGQFQQNYQMTSTASLSASKTSMTTAETSTLTPSLSSNSSYNTLKSTTYSVTRNSGSGTGSVTNGVFSATGAGTYTVTATVTYNAKDFTGITKTATASKQITVTAATNPAATSVSLSQSPSSNIYAGETQVTYTATVSGAVSGAKYNFKVDGVSKQNTTSKTFTCDYATAGSYSVTVTVNATGYDDKISSAVTTTVTDRPSVYFKYNQSGGSGLQNTDGVQMTYDSSLSKYKLSLSLDSGSSNNNWYYIVIWDASESHNLSYNSGTLTETPHTGSGFTIYNSSNDLNNPIHMVASVTGTYIFYFDASTNALFMECPHTVSFNANGHGTAPSSQVVTYNDYATEPSALSATGYTFGGWFLDSDCTDGPFPFSTTPITTTFTLYAKWTAKQYNINYYDSGGSAFSGTHGSGYPTKHTYGTATTLKSASKNYYTFGGWFTNSGCTGSAVTSLGATAYTADINLYAKWTPTTYYIDLYHNGGTVSTSGWTLNNTYYRKSYTYESSAITLPTPTRDGYTFVGWYTTNASSGGTKVTSVPNHSNGNKTYYARWTENDYTVTLHQEHSGSYTAAVLSSSWGTGLTNISRNVNEQTTFGYRVTTSTITLPTAEDFTSPVVVSGVNYIFVGWYENSSFTGSAVEDIPTGSSGNRTLYARWEAPIATNFYNNVDGTLISTEYCATGGSVTPPSPPSISGYTAVSNSWLNSSGNSVNSSVFSNITASANYYAVYNINTPTLTLTVTSVPAALEGNGTEANPLRVEYGATLTGVGTFDTLPAAATNGNTFSYSDEWANNAATNFSTPAAYDSEHPHTYTFDTTKTRLVGNVGIYHLSVKAHYNGYINSATQYNSASADLKIYYYLVDSPITAFNFETPQKIYMESDSASSATMPIRATISTKVPDTYKANLRMFDLISGSPLTYGYQDIINDEVKDLPKLHDTDPTADEAIKVFDSILASYINTRGVKNFDLQVQRPADADPTTYQIDSAAAHISTVVGTKGSSASRVLYFKNNTGSAITGRLTVVYIEGGSMEYQTAQPVSANLYRFIIPASVNNVYFCIADNSVEYRQPYYNGSVITYDSSFTGYKTTSVDVNESAQTYIATNLTGEITGSMGKL